MGLAELNILVIRTISPITITAATNQIIIWITAVATAIAAIITSTAITPSKRYIAIFMAYWNSEARDAGLAGATNASSSSSAGDCIAAISSTPGITSSTVDAATSPGASSSVSSW